MPTAIAAESNIVFHIFSDILCGLVLMTFDSALGGQRPGEAAFLVRLHHVS